MLAGSCWKDVGDKEDEPWEAERSCPSQIKFQKNETPTHSQSTSKQERVGEARRIPQPGPELL